MLLTKIKETIATATQADIDEVLKNFSNQSEATILNNPSKLKAFRSHVAGRQSQLVATAEGIVPKIEVKNSIASEPQIEAKQPIATPQEPVEATDRKATLQAQIKALTEQAEIDELEEQFLELKAQQAQKARDITALRETVLDSEEALVGQRAAIEFREKNSETVLELAKSVGVTGSQGQFDKTIAALNRSLEIVTDTPVEAELALGEMGKRRAAMRNRMMITANSTPDEIPQMKIAGSEMKTVTIDA